jgi:hypothetical protein
MKLLIPTTYILADLLASALALIADEITNSPVVPDNCAIEFAPHSLSAPRFSVSMYELFVN